MSAMNVEVGTLLKSHVIILAFVLRQISFGRLVTRFKTVLRALTCDWFNLLIFFLLFQLDVRTSVVYSVFQ